MAKKKAQAMTFEDLKDLIKENAKIRGGQLTQDDLDAFLDDLFGPDDGVEWSEEKHKHFEEVNNRCPISPTRNEWPNIKMHRQRSNDDWFKLVH